MDMSKAMSIIEKNILVFHGEIRSSCQIDCKKIHTEKSDFPIFQPANREFFEYKYYEGVLEWYIRDYLVTPILCELFEESGNSVLVPTQNDSLFHVHFKYSNEAFGNDYPFAFIIQKNQCNTAVCYSSPYFNDRELNRLFEDNGLDHIEIIDWSDTDRSHSIEVAGGVAPQNRDKVYYVTLHEFFEKHFSEDVYITFVNKVIDAVADANNEIGFNTIPNLSLRYLSDFKAIVLNELSSFPLAKEQYHEFDINAEPSGNFYNLLSTHDYTIITNRLNMDRLLSSLIGSEKFAKCFLTSEYLYQVFKRGNERYFDYSSVATGYFKSVELLLKKIMDLALDCTGHENLWIKCKKYSKKNIDNTTYRYNPNPKANGAQIRFVKEKEDEFSTEMGPLIWFIHDRSDGWNISRDGKELVHRCLQNYNKSCRNEHLHKDIIDDIESLKITRTNTILCLCFLLGGCKFTDIPKEDGQFLGIENNSYDRLYKELIKIPRSVNYYYIKFPWGEPIMAIRLYDQEKPQYDAHGNIQSNVTFVKVEDFHFEDYESFLSGINEDNTLMLDRNNVPEKMWWYNRYKGKVQILW